MLRLVFSLFLWVSVGRWTYSEIELLAPKAIPAVDALVEFLDIPTHDKWDFKKVEQFVGIDFREKIQIALNKEPSLRPKEERERGISDLF